MLGATVQGTVCTFRQNVVHILAKGNSEKHAECIRYLAIHLDQDALQRLLDQEDECSERPIDKCKEHSRTYAAISKARRGGGGSMRSPTSVRGGGGAAGDPESSYDEYAGQFESTHSSSSGSSGAPLPPHLAHLASPKAAKAPRSPSSSSDGGPLPPHLAHLKVGAASNSSMSSNSPAQKAKAKATAPAAAKTAVDDEYADMEFD